MAAASTDGHHDRLQAARGLASVLRDGRTLDQFEATTKLTPLTSELLYGSCRYYRPLSARLQPLLKQPLRKKDQDVWALLIVGAYQLQYLRIPDHAAISATVQAAKRLKKPWAGGLVNAILRGLQRAGLESPGAEEPLLPNALLQQLRDHYGAASDAIASALTTRAPMALRVNASRQPPQAYAKKLAAANIGFRRGVAPETLILDSPQPQESLPGYAEGAVAVQDAGAQFANAALAQLGGRQAARVLDACAAPGGKLFHLIESCAAAPPNVTALELRGARMERLHAEAKRLGHLSANLQLITGDGTGRAWWDGAAFDLILLDVPCSGSGTLRRHPDIALLRDFSDLSQDQTLQDQLLANLAGMLAPGGHLLYATCSVLPQENDERIAALLGAPHFSHLASVGLTLPSGAATRHGWQLLPTDPDTDGFYYAGVKNLK